MTARAIAFMNRLKPRYAGLASPSSSSFSTLTACTATKYRCAPWPGGGAAPMNRLRPASLRKMSAAPGNSLPSPAPAGKSVTVAGRLATAQCQNPDAVGASGSYMVTAKLRVSSGNPDHDSCGEVSEPPAPMMPLTWSLDSGCPSVTDSDVRVNDGSLGRNSYGL